MRKKDDIMGIFRIKLPQDPFLNPYKLNDVSNWTRVDTEWMGARKKYILFPPSSNQKYMIKFPNYGNNEILTEIFNCHLAINLKLNTALYFPCIYKGEMGVITKSFIKQEAQGSELWEMKELICHYSNLPNIEFKMGRDRDVLSEHNVDFIIMILQNEFGEKVLPDFFRMIGYDCLIGHGDRHWCNYGVILSYQKNLKSLEFNFAPIYDTASGYLLEMPDDMVNKILSEKSLDNEEWYRAKIKGLCKITVKGDPKTNHIELFEYLLENKDYTKYSGQLIDPIKRFDIKTVKHLLGNYFKDLSPQRKSVIIKILDKRNEILRNLIKQKGFS